MLDVNFHGSSLVSTMMRSIVGRSWWQQLSEERWSMKRTRFLTVIWLLFWALNPARAVVFLEDFSNGIGAWTAGTEQDDHHTGETPDVANAPRAAFGGALLTSTSSCFSAPFNGVATSLTRMVSLPPGEYEIKASVYHRTELYGYCAGQTTGRSEVWVDGSVALSSWCPRTRKCGECRVQLVQRSRRIVVGDSGQVTVTLRSHGGDCAIVAGFFDNIRIHPFLDCDDDGVLDAVDLDDDNDGILDAVDPCPFATDCIAVKDRHLFYNDSSFDEESNDDAVATDKTALREGAMATFSNYSSYSKGINGVIIDVAELPLPHRIDVDDFRFRMGSSQNLASWALAPDPIVISVEAAAGTIGTHRITLEWSNNVIQNQWLEVTLLANADTGLANNDVFYFGNSKGDSGNSTENAQVDVSDEVAARNNPRNFLNPASIDFAYDYNRDGKVDVSDEILARNNASNFLTAPQLLDLTAVQGAVLVRSSIFSVPMATEAIESSIGLVIRRSEVSGELFIETKPTQLGNLRLQYTTQLDSEDWVDLMEEPTFLPNDYSGKKRWRIRPTELQVIYRLIGGEDDENVQSSD